MNDFPHLGSGWAFPVRWDATGRVRRSEGVPGVEQSIGLIVRTAMGERVMRPDFGAGADRHVFEPRTPQACFRLSFEVRQALLRFEPRIIVEHVEALPAGEDRIDVFVEYRVDTHRRPTSLVLPFYLQDQS